MVDVLILEGVSCGRAALGDRAGVLVWLTVADRRARLERAVGRDGEPSRPHLAAWQDAEDAFFRRDDTARPRRCRRHRRRARPVAGGASRGDRRPAARMIGS